MCALLPWRGRYRALSNKLLEKVSRYLLAQVILPEKFVLVMHSDALPFARSILYAAKNNLTIQSLSVCLQHGIFHEHFECTELDGSLADINVARSEFDKALIEKNNKESFFIISEDFFIPAVGKIDKKNNKNKNKPVILVGEGFHVVDKDLSIKYISRLKAVEAELLNKGWCVKYRPHPSEKLIYRSFGFKNIDALDLKSSLAIALAYIGYSSTLLIEASSIGIPCYSLSLDGEARVKLHRNDFREGVAEYQPSSFFPKTNGLDFAIDADAMRVAAVYSVFSKIEEILHG
jgi:hypothetical protein